MRKRQVEVAKAEMVAPPVPAAEALQNNFAYQFLRKMGSRMDKAVDALADKCDAGDTECLRIFMETARALATANRRATPHVTNMQQAIVVSSNAHATLSELRHDIVRILAIQGPQPSEAVAAHFSGRGILANRVTQALNHSWFEKEADGWHITDKARVEVLEASHCG